MYSINVTEVSFHVNLFSLRSNPFVVSWNLTDLSSCTLYIVQEDSSSRQSSSFLCIELHQAGMNLSQMDHGSSFARRHRCDDFVDSTHYTSIIGISGQSLRILSSSVLMILSRDSSMIHSASAEISVSNAILPST